jgi:ABC-2 type transport system permease protein
MSGFALRLNALLRKETRQMLRDRSTLMVGLMLPLILILLFGYGLSFDVTDAPVAVVFDDPAPVARDAMAGIAGSPYLAPVYPGDMGRAIALMRAHRVDAIVHVPSDFARRRAAGDAQVQVIVNGTYTTSAQSIEGYLEGAIGAAALHDADRAAAGNGGIVLVPRLWFNDANESTWYLVPGLLVLIMTLIGAFLTSLLIAREWERGTLEALFVTPVRAVEIIIAKVLPYMLIGGIDIAICLLSARFIFHVPIRGSLVLIVLTALLYLAVSLLQGLWISGATRNQFAASQVALLASFLPASMLSGFVFDLRNVPLAVQVISQLLPATHFMAVIKTLFLAGTVWSAVIQACAILSLYILGFGFLTWRSLRKRLD